PSNWTTPESRTGSGSSTSRQRPKGGRRQLRGVNLPAFLFPKSLEGEVRVGSVGYVDALPWVDPVIVYTIHGLDRRIELGIGLQSIERSVRYDWNPELVSAARRE